MPGCQFTDAPVDPLYLLQQAVLLVPQRLERRVPRFFIHEADNTQPQGVAGIENGDSGIAKDDGPMDKISPCEPARGSRIIPFSQSAAHPT
jgi:hypothetical protein